jgi:protein-tyrosine phosphatase
MYQEEPHSYVIDNIYIGNILGLDTDIINTVEQVISLVPNQHKEQLERNNIRVYEILFRDNPDEDIILYSSLVYNILENGKKTFIHCSAGKSRSVGCIIYYLMKKHNMEFQNAYSYIQQKRPTIDINLGFYSQLFFWKK